MERVTARILLLDDDVVEDPTAGTVFSLAAGDRLVADRLTHRSAVA